MININIKNKSTITVYFDSQAVYSMKRNTSMFTFKTFGEIFDTNKKIGQISIGLLLKKEILFQNFSNSIEISKQKLYSTDFLINNNIIQIKNNPFFFFSKKVFSKIYYNSELIGIVSMRKILDIEGYNLEVKFLSQNEDVKYNSIICYLICCIEFNM